MHRLKTQESGPATEEESGLEIARAQFDRVADRLGLSAGMRDLLRSPMREFHFAIPVRMDDGTHRVFRAFRVQHNDARGPFKGGIAFTPPHLPTKSGRWQ